MGEHSEPVAVGDEVKANERAGVPETIPLIAAVAVALVETLLKVTVGIEVKPLPPAVRVRVATEALIVAVAPVAWVPPPVGAARVTVGFVLYPLPPDKPVKPVTAPAATAVAVA